MTAKREKPELLIFDLGRVLIDFDFKKVIRDLKQHTHLNEQQIQHFFENTPMWDSYERGKIDSEEFFRRLSEALELKGLTFDAFKPLWCDIFTAKHDTIELLETLRGQYKLAMLSNVNQMHWEFVRDRHGFMHWFQLPVASYAVGMRKPDAAIYQYVLDQAGVPASKALFTDDIEAHITAAKSIGIDAHLFTTAAQLKKDWSFLFEA